MNNKKTEIIAFFSSEGFFRLRTEENKKKRFEELKEAYEKEFDEPLKPELFDYLIQYDAEQKQRRKDQQKQKELKKASLPIASGLNNISDHIKTLPAGKYVLSCAQNNTHVHEIVLKCLINFCQHNNAKLLIARITYNKNGFCQPDINNDNELWYDPKVKPYLVSGHIDLQGLHFLADSNVIPTARNPLSGFDAATQAGIHAVIPHTKIALSVVAALKNSPTKTLASTGTVTKSNYIMRKVGAVATLEHCLGGLFIDTTDKKNIIIRQLELIPDCNYIYDLNKQYCDNGEVLEGEFIECLQPGDIHAEKMTQKSFDKIVSLMQELKPKYLILHDILDFRTRNHHNIKDCTFLHGQLMQKNTVKGDLMIMTELIDKFIKYCEKLYIIESNHDQALMTWLKNEDFKKDAENAIFYLECMLAIYKHQEIYDNLDNLNILEYVYTYLCKGQYSEENFEESFEENDRKLVNFSRVDESLIIAGIEHGCHGHNGANGSKGSPQQFKKLGIAMNTGHTHSPSIHGKVYTAGVSASLEMGYNVGASSWAIAHIITYNNGQRQIIFS